MGTGHSIDSPIRVAPFGISSVISVVDDLLLERIRAYYCGVFGFPYEKIARKEDDGRAKRVTAYLDMVGDIVTKKFNDIRNQPFFEKNDKARYFEMLPDHHELKALYSKLLKIGKGEESRELEEALDAGMRPGSIDVNIMVKLDKINYENGKPMSDEFSDAKAALRGYAQSKISSGIVFSAGINQPLFGYMAKFRDFYRNAEGVIKKKIILKVSDFRSALIQGKFLARKGLEVHEFRIESGLNCGGHAFPSDGELLPFLLKEFSEKREQLKEQFMPYVRKFYDKAGWTLPDIAEKEEALLTVQGGIGTAGEAKRLFRDYGVERTGWASPFLLVPEATCIDDPTVELLIEAKEKDLYLSGASPLGIPFNNVRNSGSDLWTRGQAEKGRPGSACPKGFLVSNTEFSELPICTASREYQSQKLEVLPTETGPIVDKVLEKACICDHLGNGALIALGVAKEAIAPQSICPGPNIAWFDRRYTLEEMVDHIYGRSASLVPEERPHMYAKEIRMYMDWVDSLRQGDVIDDKLKVRIRKISENFRSGLEYCESLLQTEFMKDENQASLASACEDAKTWLSGITEEEASEV
jgi:hypothetical protein